MPENNAFVWAIKNFPGGKEYLMRAQFKLPSVIGEEVESRRPINISFEIPYFTTSGIQVSNQLSAFSNTIFRFAI